MKNFKKLLAVLLAGLMLLSLVACGGKESTDKSGVLQMEMLQSAVKHTDDCSINAGSKSREIYSNLSAALMDLESGKIIGKDMEIDFLEALRGYTINAAYSSFEEKIKGSLEVGKSADFVIMSGRVMNKTPEELRNISVVSTYLGGRKTER